MYRTWRDFYVCASRYFAMRQLSISLTPMSKSSLLKTINDGCIMPIYGDPTMNLEFLGSNRWIPFAFLRPCFDHVTLMAQSEFPRPNQMLRMALIYCSTNLSRTVLLLMLPWVFTMSLLDFVNYKFVLSSHKFSLNQTFHCDSKMTNALASIQPLMWSTLPPFVLFGRFVFLSFSSVSFNRLIVISDSSTRRFKMFFCLSLSKSLRAISFANFRSETVCQSHRN